MSENMKTDLLDIRLADCMDVMREYPDGYFDLAIVDPPYGIGVAAGSFISKNPVKGRVGLAKDYGDKRWDSVIPDRAYFDELFRVAKKHIIWGGNYFASMIQRNSPCWIVWDKENGDSSFADVELAFTSFGSACRKFNFRWAGMLQGNMANKENRIHPTQKPVALYRWLLAKYAERGQRILDTHLGSGSSAIACHYARCPLVACEIDPDYYAAACARIERETAQPHFDFEPVAPPPVSQHDMFASLSGTPGLAL